MHELAQFIGKSKLPAILLWVPFFFLVLCPVFLISYAAGAIVEVATKAFKGARYEHDFTNR